MTKANNWESCLRLNVAADMLGVTRDALRKMQVAGKVDMVKVGNHHRVPLSEILRLVGEKGLGGDFYMTIRVRDRGTLELLRALVILLNGTEIVSTNLESVIVSMLAHSAGGEGDKCNEQPKEDIKS